jgi:hypothetical protein
VREMQNRIQPDPTPARGLRKVHCAAAEPLAERARNPNENELINVISSIVAERARNPNAAGRRERGMNAEAPSERVTKKVLPDGSQAGIATAPFRSVNQVRHRISFKLLRKK